MTTGLVSEKGQITLPASARRKLGIQPQSRVEILVREGEIVIRPLKTISEVAGVFHRYARNGSPDWDAEREAAERAVARQVADE